MKTNQVMIRKMGTYEVRQRTVDSMFNASSILREYNKKNGVRKRIDHFLMLESTKDFLDVLSDDMQVADNQVWRDPTILDNQEVRKIPGIIHKTNASTTSKGVRKAGEIWFHPYLFLDFAMWINPKFKLQVVKFVYDQLIEFRHNAGDQYKGLASALTMFENVDYSKVAMGLNYIVFGKHEPELRQNATQQQLKSLSSLQEKLAFAVNMGYISSYQQLLTEMRRIYRVRDQYLALK